MNRCQLLIYYEIPSYLPPVGGLVEIALRANCIYPYTTQYHLSLNAIDLFGYVAAGNPPKQG